MLTAPKIRPALETHGPLVEAALAWIFPDPGQPINLDGLEQAADVGEDTADVLSAFLNQEQVASRFVSFLRARGVDLLPATEANFWDQPGAAVISGIQIPDPPDPDFDFATLGDFAARASAYRCRICVDGQIAGSGAFVSSRLVLTAAHVLNLDQAAPLADGQMQLPDLPPLQVIASDDMKYDARLIWYMPFHPDEHAGQLPPNGHSESHCDVALLRVFLPLGQSYGRVPLPQDPPDWTGPQRFALVHYPDGAERGFHPGKILRNGPDDIRLVHNIETEHGSSGGPGFDRDLRFLGLHQGRWQNVRRLVPFEKFRQNPGFRTSIEADRPPRYLWSLNRDLDGPIILGRRHFFSGLAAILDKPESLLKGIWVRRLDTSQTRGLGFSFEMLQAFLATQEPTDTETPGNQCFSIPTDLATEDLIGKVATSVLGADDTITPLAGVRVGETSDVAGDEERAVRLAQRLQDHAAQHKRFLWLFFENPPNGLGSVAQIQFEHLVEHVSKQASLRLILAGFETYRLAPLRFANAEEAKTARAAGLLVDRLGAFSRTDVEVTLAEILRSLSDEAEFNPNDMRQMVDQITLNLETTRPGEFVGAEMAQAIERIRQTVKLRIGLI